MKICIDAGHGGADAGAVNGARYEKNDNLRLSLKVKELLEPQGIQVILTRSGDNNPTLKERTDLSNREKADYFLSIHRNSFGNESAKGAEIWVYSKASTNTFNQGKGILDEVLKVIPFTNRGIKKGYTGNASLDYHVNRETNCPSALIELGFISNSEDNSLYDSKFNEIALAIIKGLCKAVGVQYKEPKPVEPPKPATPPTAAATKLYRVQVGGFSNRDNAERLKKDLESKGYSAIIV